MANAVGRPTKYNAEVQAVADRYIGDFVNQGDVVPSQAGLCVWLGISKHTSQEWGKIHPEFSATLEAIKVIQEKLTLSGGLTSTFNATICKLLLANHGYSEKQQIEEKSETTIRLIDAPDAD